MSKSILIVDTPENCKECEFSAERMGGKDRCALNKDTSNIIIGNGRPYWCPLKEVPQKVDESGIYDEEYYRAQGYNYCIDELIGGDGNE